MDWWLVTGAVVLQLIAATMILLVITSLKPLERATKAQKSTAKWQWRVFIFAIVIPVQAMITLLLVCGLFVPY